MSDERTIGDVAAELKQLLRERQALTDRRCVECGARAIFPRCERCETQYQLEQRMYRR